MERRDFLKAAGSGVAALTATSFQKIYGANNRIRIGLIGCGGRGTVDARLMRGTTDDIRAIAPECFHNGNLDHRLSEPRKVDIAEGDPTDLTETISIKPLSITLLRSRVR